MFGLWKLSNKRKYVKKKKITIFFSLYKMESGKEKV